MCIQRTKEDDFSNTNQIANMFDKDTKDIKDSVSETSSIDEAPPPYSSSSSSQSPVPQLIPDASNLFTIVAFGNNCSVNASSQLQIPVFRGTDTTADPLYVSERFKRESGKAILRHKDRGAALASLYTRKLHDPKIRRLDSTYGGQFLEWDTDVGEEIVEIKSKWYSKALTLTNANDGRAFEWAYTRTETHGNRKKRVLALSLQDSHGKDEMVIAVLLRSTGTRTPGTSRWEAGNGGQLILHPEAARYLDEDVIVASCIMMLKREMDRARANTIAAIS